MKPRRRVPKDTWKVLWGLVLPLLFLANILVPVVAWAEEELLKARTLEDRTALLMTLMGIELDTTSRHQSPSPPTIN